MTMTQDERWTLHYQEILKYMRTNKRRPSKHHEEDIPMHNWIKQNKKLLNKGLLPKNRINRFTHLLDIARSFRRVNQYAYLDKEED